MSQASVINGTPEQLTMAGATAGSGVGLGRRYRLSKAERAAMVVVAVATAGFAVYGALTSAPSTVAYVFTVVAVGVVLTRFRQNPLPPALALALAVLAIAHLAGGLVRVGGGVLYNASVGSEVFQYDHLVHSTAVFVGTLVVWTLFARSGADPVGRRSMAAALWVLAGLGLGAVNETVEFVTTLLNEGTHIGGYANTGWDLVSNVVGAFAAGVVIARTIRRGERDDRRRQV